MAITYDAPSDTITISSPTTASCQDIYDEDISNGWGQVTKQGDNSFHFACNLHVASGGTLRDTETLIEIGTSADRKVLTSAAGGTIHLGTKDGNGYVYDGCALKMHAPDAWNDWKGTTKLYGSVCLLQDTDRRFELNGISDVKGSILTGYRSWAIGASASGIIEDTLMEGEGSYPTIYADITFNNVVFSKWSIGALCYISVTIANAEFKGITTAILDIGNASTVHLKNVISDNWTFVLEHNDAIAYREYTYDPIVTDTSGSPIANATIKMEEKIGAGSWATLWEKTTGADGKLSDGAQTIIYQKISTTSETVEQYYHRVTVTKTGYAVFGPVEIKVDHKIEDDIIVLGALTYTYDDIMKAVKINKALITAFA